MGGAGGPAYLRVLEDLRAQIRGGLLPPGARVPSRNGIITRYGVGETAAKHALRVLAAEGLIETRAGSGSFVRALPAAQVLEHDRPHFPGSPFGLAGWPAANGHGSTVPAGQRLAWEHQTDQLPAPPRIARRLGVPDGEPLTRTRYLLTSDGVPVQLAVSYEPAALTAGSPVAFPEEGPHAGRGVAERMRVIGVGVDMVTEDISVRPCQGAEADALAIPPGALVLVTERAHCAGERTVEAGEVVVPADRFRLRYRFPLAR
jgi:GntR family transcriptional regulator